MTVGEMEDRMGSSELFRWIQYEREEPFLPERVELNGGIIASTLANIHRGKNTPPFAIMDFMPVARQAAEVSRVEAHRRAAMPDADDDDDALVQRMVAAFGGHAYV
jgi:hypothetical protein